MLEEHEAVLMGREFRPGLMERMQTLEEWRQERDRERRVTRALVIGVSLGLAGNLVGTFAILRTILIGGL